MQIQGDTTEGELAGDEDGDCLERCYKRRAYSDQERPCVAFAPSFAEEVSSLKAKRRTFESNSTVLTCRRDVRRLDSI